MPSHGQAVNFPKNSKPRPPRSLIRPLMPHRNLHLERIATIPQILRNKHSRLLADKQRRAISVAAHIIRADGQIGAFKTFDAVDVEALVEDAVFDDGVALAGGHGAGAEAWCTGWFSLWILDLGMGGWVG